ncbi:putative NADH ubiquinone oxidoreductase 20.1kD subunit [Lyophyllum shimeji]|uniref:NADH ubiquinone oxidoreductase 20.1kD subunit n=1 Tax=Lyophyllum shimeji TaxID=47721 RepID=A0A9P3UQL7_LYOSH|nr:putative NADH ubiquinone oxidoreductase 20.1kD subunit [Lyophyllum shimeji]
MTTTIVLRRAVAASSSASRLIALRSARHQHVRTIATTAKEEEQDPQLNGYPRLPYVSRQTLPPHGWWDPQMRRNFGDPLHEEDEVLSMWGPDPAPLPPSTALRDLMIAASVFVGLGLIVKYALVPEPPAFRREYPYDGLVSDLGGLEENKARPESIGEEE